MRKLFTFLFFILIALFLVLREFIPDLVSDDLKKYCLDYLGPSYSWYFVGIFVFTGLVISSMWSKFNVFFPLSQQIKKEERIKIPWSQEAEKCLQSAKEMLSEAQPEETIKTLQYLKNPAVDKELSLISARLAEHRRESRRGILTSEQQNTAINRINNDVIGLIGDIENQLADGEKENRQLRDAFRQGYRNRLDQKLASRQPVNLRRFATTEGTSAPVAATFVPYSSDTIREEIGKTFQAARGRLLIVGQPGAGKTTLLLQLADRLFDLEADALPIVLNLATWQSRFGELETWLEAVLVAELSTNQAGARAVLRQSKLLLLLDGLDELKEDEAINSCLAAIANYGAVAGRRFVITCRMEEYKRVQEDARVNLQIEVGPLQGEQLETELARMGREQPEAVPLLQAIQNDPLLRQAVETPFYFNTLQLLFAGRLPVFTATDLEGRKAEIKQKFVDNALQNIQNKGYLPQPATHWLSFLASRMNERNQVTFELRDLQYDWWKRWSRWNIFTANFINRLVLGLVGGLVFGLFVGLVFGLVGGLVVGLVDGLVDGLVGGLNNKIAFEIYTRDLFQWSIQKYLEHIREKLISVLVFGLVFGLVYGLFVGLVGGLFVGLFFGLVGGLVNMINNETSDFIQIKSPHQRFYASMKMLHFSILQHWHLRRLLYQKGALPLDLVAFLNKMTACKLLETDGATWRFRHRIIQDYFAEQWVEPTQEKQREEQE